MTEFDPQKIFEVLHEHEIDFVVIGAMAAVLQGAALTATFDVDIAAATSDVNRTRLASHCARWTRGSASGQARSR